MAENRELALVLKLVADEFQKELRNSQGALSSFNTFLKDWKTQLAAAGTALFALAKSTANYGEEALKGAQKAGTTVESYTALAHAAKMADVESQGLINGMKTLSVNMAEAARGNKEAESLFARMGVSVVDATGKMRSIEDVMLDLADVFKHSADGAGKNEASIKLYGKAWEGMLPFMNQGREVIRGAMEDSKRLGVQMSTQDAVAANRFNDEIKKLEATTRGFSLQLGKELVPAFTQLMKVMGEGATGPISKVFKLEMQGLASIFTLLSHGIREVGLEMDIFFKKIGKTDSVKKFWDDVLVQSRKNLDRDTDKRLHQIFQDQLGAVGGNQSPSPPASGGRDVQMGAIVAAKDQEKLGKALLEIFLAQNRALEIQWRLQQSLAQDEHVRERERAEDAAIEEAKGRRIVSDTQQLAVGREQEQLGRQILQQTQAQLAIDEQRRRESMTFFDHWTEGLQRYLGDTQSAFGFAADLARRTGQFMEQSFRTFFFDLMDNRIKSLKDLFESFGNFAKQIISQVLAQLATMMALKAITAGFGGGFSLGGLFGGGGGSMFGADAGGLGMSGLKFASGGPVLGSGNRDTVRALLTPGEGVLNRHGMQALAQLNTGMMPTASDPNITVNVVNPGRTDQPQVNYRRQMKGMIIDIIYRDPDLRQMLAGA